MGSNGGEEGSTMGMTPMWTRRWTEDDKESTNEEGVEEDPIVGNGFVKEAAEELAGSRTRQDVAMTGGGGHL